MTQIERDWPGSADKGDKTKVFVSYSRRDREFVDRLVRGLEAHEHIDVFRDTDDILPTEEWKLRLERLIGEADTIVFCLSPDSATSEICHWEVECAQALNKRVVPVVLREVESGVPESLAKLNYIFFTRPEDFDRSLSYLSAALDADIAWVREHTRLGELSRRWQRSGHPKHQLLHGADVQAAEAWARQRTRNAPEPLESTLRYIAASRREASAKKMRARAVLATLTVAAGAGLAAWHYEREIKRGIFWFTEVRSYVHTAAMVHALPPRQSFKDCKGCPEMIVVPAGSFMMGSPSPADKGEHPQFEVKIARPFAVGRFEVTFSEWDLCVKFGDCAADISLKLPQRELLPVTNINWQDAKRYVDWISRLTGQRYRFLTESEWEYAARAGRTTAYAWGDQVGRGNFNCTSCGGQWKRQTLPVGSFPANAFGLHDMHGNAAEWVEDCYNFGYQRTPADGSASLTEVAAYGQRFVEGCNFRSIRGGSWAGSAAQAAASARDSGLADDRKFYVGFRVARNVDLR